VNEDTGHRILLFHGRGLISALIRWQTRGQFSHAAILCPNGDVLESWQGTGVRETRVSPGNGVTRFRVPYATAAQWAQVETFCRMEIGRKYDYLAIARFVSRRHMGENDRWFCSELVFSAFVFAGIRLLSRIDASQVSPQLLSLSPMLTE